MKPKVLFSIMFVLFMLFYTSESFSQTFNLIITNNTWDGAKVFTVDIYVQSTNADPLEYATNALGLQFPDDSRNGGTITATIDPATSQLTNTAQIPTSINATGTAVNGGITYRLIKIAGKTPPSAGNGSMIAVGSWDPVNKIMTGGTRFYTLKLTNSANWVITGNNDLNIAVTGYPSSMNFYIGGINTNIWANGTVIISTTTSTLLPVELSSFVSNVSGRQVNLNWETKTEVNSSKFEIDRALVGTKDATVTWSSVGTVQAAGNSNSPKKYSYTDKNIQAGKYQYRLKTIDNDGSYKLSDVVETEIALPKNFELSQNYPNPFNPSTKINYQVPVDAKVILDVYNITGQKVAELVNQEQSAGYYSVNFASSKLSSGVYIYRLSANDKATGNNFSSIKKMMLLK